MSTESKTSAVANQRTPLFAAHQKLGAKMVNYGGWDMPLQYRLGIVKEHKAVRSAMGVFDVSHMGEISLRGPKAQDAAHYLATNDVSRLADGDALYTLMCRENAGIVDDCIVYRRSENNFLFIVNAANCAKDLAWISQHSMGAEVIDESNDTALIAVQGPEARGLVRQLASDDTDAIERFRFAQATVANISCMVARTGYTGEEGFEIACPTVHAPALWNALVNGGATPIGLGARDTLRLEAKLCLYGNDITEETSPVEAALTWAVKLNTGDFLGRAEIARQKQEGIARKLVGFEIPGRGIARPGYGIFTENAQERLGVVTSGGPGISVGKAVGMGYVAIEATAPGTPIAIDCRGKFVPATLVKGPFYQRSE